MVAAPRRGELAGVRGGAAAAFRGVGAREKQESEENGFLGFLYCSGAREERAAGSARGCPRRRRGGCRRGGSGSYGARGMAGGTPARGNRRGRRSGATRGCQREAE